MTTTSATAGRPQSAPRRRSATTWMRQWLLRISSFGLTRLYAMYRIHPAVWRVMARGYRSWMASLARLHAWMTCQFAAIDVPAYRDFLRQREWRFRWFDLSTYPPTDKASYVKAYPEAARCWRGRIEVIGSVVDESSGSSGQPYNWVRSRRELRTVHKNLAGYTTLVFPSRRRFVINAYSMGAWATGTNTGIAMARIAMVKNTGPDLDKIIDTLHHFGPGFDYVITAYPPFLKHLRDRMDAEGFGWDQYRISALVGGEGMTEALRDYLQQRFAKVRSGYGASDLTIGIAGETDFTVWLRRRLYTDRRLRETLLGAGEDRIPMIFQYNPLETYLETTAAGEILCTVNNTAVLNPKARYNIGDEGRLMRFEAVTRAIRGDKTHWTDAKKAWQVDRIRLPLLFLFGRKDSTISYMGANIYPQDVENGLYGGHTMAHLIEGFCLSLEESADLESRPVVHVQLRDRAHVTETDRLDLAERCGRGIVAHLAAISRDFAESLSEDPTAAEVLVRVHDFHEGPFAGTTNKIKNVYLVGRGTP